MSLVTDFQPLNQPENTYPFASCLINSTEDNFQSSKAYEPGNTLIHTLPAGYRIVGKIYYSNNLLVFSTNNVNSEIGTLINDQYTTIFSDETLNDKLNFSTTHAILGQHRILRGCEDIFYWSDTINPDRYLNLNNIPQNVLEFNIRQDSIQPSIQLEVNNTGGNIRPGSIAFAIQYTDLNQNVFYTSNTTQSLPIYNDTISPAANGSFDIDNVTSTLGGRGNTSKSVTLTITNVDQKYPYLQVVAVVNNQLAYIVDQLIPTSDTVQYTYRGEQDIPLDIRELVVGNSNYITSSVNEQVQGRLLRANVQEISRDYNGIQREVMKVTVRPRVVQVPKSEYSNDPNNYQNLTFQADEVYALALVGTYDNGDETPAFHIPGRQRINTIETSTTTFNGEEVSWYLINNLGDQNRMGYYETDNEYPNITDCTGTLVYQHGATTNKIRHHKFPSRASIPLESSSVLNLLTVELDNLPVIEGITSWRLVYSREQPTVLDSGFLIKGRKDGEDIQIFPDFSGVTSTGNYPSAFISPKSLSKSIEKGNYFNIIHSFNTVQADADVLNNEGNFEQVAVFTVEPTGIEELDINIPYNDFLYLNPSEFNSSVFGEKVINESFNNTTLIADTDYGDEDSIYRSYATNKNLDIPYRNLFSIRYQNAIEIDGRYRGDTFITSFDYFNIYDMNASPGGFAGLGRTDYRVLAFHDKAYVESQVNMSLFVQGEQPNTHYDFSGTNYLLSKVAQVIDQTLTLKQVELEYYSENQNYRYQQLNRYIPLPQSYDYCSKCLQDKPTRIIFSPKSFQEELQDTYFINKVNDYIDLPANTGPITGIKYKNNRLYVHTTQTTYVLQPNPQYLTTNTEVAQLTEGDFLSVPPQQIMQTQEGYAGLQSRTGTIDTELGYYWFDGLRGTVNGITNQYLEPSRQGMISFFRNTLQRSSRVVLSYDPYYQRIIATVQSDNKCVYTISYDPGQNKWISFHPYKPFFYLNNSDHYYSNNNEGIYKHNKGDNFGQFYGTKHPFIIEQVDQKLQTHNLTSIIYYAEFFQNDQEVEDAFTHLTVYNQNQSSGKHNLILSQPYTNLNVDPTNKTVKITDKNHAISNLWDNSTSNVVAQRQCEDKVFLNTQQDNNYYNKPNFKEKYTISRLEYLPQEDRKVIYYLQNQNKQQSIR